MATPARSGHTIARAVYDEGLAAIRVTDGAVDAGEGANKTLNDTVPNSSTLVGTNAGSRKVGILIILQSDNDLYFAIGEAATANHAKLTSEGEDVFLPLNDEIYCMSAESLGSNISYVEI